MLHRSFKPAKCKTALKLASSRIKLLKNKRDAQVKQLKRELAQLLESGQEQTARIRVEHVVREEKTMAAYDLLEIYCELIVARLPIIESQKNCPIDLKEAITSIIFASPRCADIPELMDVRKHFTTKYGKEFVSAAVELRPDCGVSRLLVEKLSAKAPDGPTKIKILSAIAEEHNVRWDHTSFGEIDSKPSEDLLNGPNTFHSAGEMFENRHYSQVPPGPGPYSQVPPVREPHSQVPPGRDDKEPSYVQVPPKSNEKHDIPVNFHEHSARYQMDTGASKVNASATFHPHIKPAGSDNERVESRHSYSGDENAFSAGRQTWNMEFKDATAAARAAAESAERASMAARAAAELSSRGNTTRQHSTYSQRDEEQNRYSDSTLRNEHAKGAINVALHGRNSRMDFENNAGYQRDDKAGIAEKIHGDSFRSTKYSPSASLKSSASPVDGDPVVNNVPVADRFSQNNSLELGQKDHFGQVSFKKQSSKTEVHHVNKLPEAKSVDNFEEVGPRNQSSHASSFSPPGTINDSHNDVSDFNSQYSRSDADENPFAVYHEETIQRNSHISNSPENATAVFDDYDTDQDEYKIDFEGRHKKQEYSDFSSHSRKSPTHTFANTSPWSEKPNFDEPQRISISKSHFFDEDHSEPLFSERLSTSRVPSQQDDMLPAAFDDYDVPTSESEGELDKFNLGGSNNTNKSNVTSEVNQGENHRFTNPSFSDKGNGGSSKAFLQSSSFNTNPVEVQSGTNEGIRVDAGSARKFSYGDVSSSQSSPTYTASKLDFEDRDSCNQQVDEGKQQQFQQPSWFSKGQEIRDNVLTPSMADATEDTETSEESSVESGKELNFANLTGGLRNKVYKHPPYKKSMPRNVSSVKQTARDTSTMIEESVSVVANLSISPESTSQDPYIREVRTESDTRPSARSHFHSHNDDSYAELPEQTSTSRKEQYNKKGEIEENKRSSSRTLVNYLDVTDSDAEDDYPKEALMSKPHFNTGFSRRTIGSPSNFEKSSSPKTTVFPEASVIPDYNEERNSSSKFLYRAESRQRPLSQNKSAGSSEKSRLSEEPAKNPITEPKRSFFEENLMPSAKEQSSNSLPKIVTSGRTESLKTSSGETPSKEKASHVHPKLPDYDAITAHLQSLRKNRQ